MATKKKSTAKKKKPVPKTPRLRMTKKQFEALLAKTQREVASLLKDQQRGTLDRVELAATLGELKGQLKMLEPHDCGWYHRK